MYQEYVDDEYKDVNPKLLFDDDWILEQCPENIRDEWDDIINGHEKDWLGEDRIGVMWESVRQYSHPYVSCKFFHGEPFWTTKTMGNSQECIDDMNMRIIRSIKRKSDEWNKFLNSDKPTDIGEVFGSLQFSIPKQYRCQGLLEYFSKNINFQKFSNKQVWELIIHVWVGTEFPSQSQHIWEKLFDLRPRPKSLTKNLPDEMTIYRGGSPDGWSWTLDEKRGRWFSNRYSHKFPCLFHSRKIKKEDVLFYTNIRQEQEVVVVPKDPLHLVKIISK